MHRFWDIVLEPALRIVGPDLLLGIGTQGEEIHAHLAGFCREHDCTFVAAGDLDEVLSDLDTLDAVTVAGDSNWHAVTRLLERIEAW